jgi:hypothetical protein
VLRTATGDDERRVEYSARLDLRAAGDRAIAERALRPGGGAADMRALTAAIAARGVVERDGYAVSVRRRGFGIAGKLGVALALDHRRTATERRLVDSVAWVRGAAPVQRFDCLGV